MNWEWWVQQWDAGVNPGTSNPQVNCMYGEAIGKNESPWSGAGEDGNSQQFCCYAGSQSHKATHRGRKWVCMMGDAALSCAVLRS